MGDDLVPVLVKFHREVLLPDIRRVVAETEARLRGEMQTGFDALAHRLDRLETEYAMVKAGLQRLEERMDSLDHRLQLVEQKLDRVEQRLDKLALRSELVELKTRVEALQDQVRTLEARLGE